ncbi:MAG: hypothetical protein IKR18_01850 [Bacteroidaceae bacterium]|nr:hypothetical protein [Bacteroidaceae bacterium]
MKKLPAYSGIILLIVGTVLFALTATILKDANTNLVNIAGLASIFSGVGLHIYIFKKRH